MVTTGTVESRPHSKLAPGHGIPYPQNLEVRYIREKETHTNGTDDYTTNEVEEMREQASASFDTQWQAKKLNMAPVPAVRVPPSSSDILSSATSVASVPGGYLPAGMTQVTPPSAEEIRDRAVVAHIRKAHNAWDRSKRELHSIISQSKANENTKGCKSESDLAGYIIEGDAEDAVLVQLEQKFMMGERYSVDEISNSSAKAQNVKDIIKKSSKITVAMKPWFVM